VSELCEVECVVFERPSVHSADTEFPHIFTMPVANSCIPDVNKLQMKSEKFTSTTRCARITSEG
jgi:hypothetical protein